MLDKCEFVDVAPGAVRLEAHRVAKGWKLSGNFGNFPWKVLGIFNGLEILGILGTFIFIVFNGHLLFSVENIIHTLFYSTFPHE